MCKYTKKHRYNTIEKQQMSKAITNYYVMELIKANPNSPMIKAYRNTYYCNSVKHYDGEKMRGSYCKNRWCYTCNRIRTAININNYSPQISEMGHPHFVTLTRPTCTIDELPDQIKHIEGTWRKIYNRSKDKRRQPFKNGIFLKGIKSLECTLRPDGKYHFHVHLIVDGWANAEWIRSEWLRRNPDSSAKAQDVRPADKGALLEVFKYAIKMTAKIKRNTDFERLDALYRLLKGKRTFSAFGGLRVPKIDVDDDFEVESQYYQDIKLRLGNEESIWSWNYEFYDWINVDTGEFLVGKELPKIIKNSIETPTKIE